MAAQDHDDVGPQGGDPRARPAGVRLDLSTCVCRYGPPPSALAVLRDLPASVLRRHPYGAEDVLAEAYAAYLAVDPNELVVGRGASELIWQLAASELGPRVVVPRPGYTEYQRAFPGAGVGPLGVHHAMEVVAEQLAAGRVVLLSNPHNPSGRSLDPRDLLGLAAGAPGGVLVVDESYAEFAPDPAAASVLGDRRSPATGDVPANVIVLRSPSKFFGLAGARVGVAWSPSERLRAILRGRRGSWPVSALEVVPVVAALADGEWIAATHAALRSDACWLAGRLRRFATGRTATFVDGSVAHFHLLAVDDVERAAAAFAAAGIGARAIGRGHGLAGPALRLAAPRVDERALGASMLATAFAALPGPRS